MAYAMKNAPLQEWRVVAASCGLLSGILCGLVGSLLTGISWFVKEPHNQKLLHTLGGIILCLTIPLLLLGGFCMDETGKNDACKKAADDEDNDDES